VKRLKVTNPQAYCTPLIASTKGFISSFQGANVIKLLTTVTYCHSMAIPSFCVIRLYYLGNYHGMAVNYCGIVL
jgi:hypothetical protein